MNQWPLVGRLAELHAILERLERVPPAAVVVSGASGVGKSRLLREVAAQCASRQRPAYTVFGTAASASIPFGAVASLLAQRLDDASATEILNDALRLLTGADETTAVVLVDDAQRLDSGSAALIHDLVARHACAVVLTVRDGEPAPDAIERLWTSGVAERVDLGALTRQQTGELLVAVLGGRVDGATQQRLWVATRGNALYLRELLAGALADGSLRDEGGVWRMRGPTVAPPRLVELIAARLDALGEHTRSAVDVLAVAEPVALGVLTSLVDVTVLEALEHAGAIEVVDDDLPRVVFAHPLYGEAARSRLGVLRRRRVCAAVADAIEAAGMAMPGDLVRVATCRLDGGQPVDPGLLTTAARWAYNAHDLDLATRLAGAARAAGGGVDAGLVLAETAMLVGRHEDAAALLAELAAEADSDEERAAVADSRAITLGVYLGRDDEARSVVSEVLAMMDDVDLTDALLSSLAFVLVQASEPAAAVETVRPVLARPSSPAFHRAAYAASVALALTGKLDEAIDVGRRGWSEHSKIGSSIHFLAEAQFFGPVYAECAAGRPANADDLTSRGYEAAVVARHADVQANFAVHAGLTAVLMGRLAVAIERFREAAAVNRELNDLAGLRWALGGVALAAGMASDGPAGEAAIAELGSTPPPVQLFELDLIERGRAWAAAARGERSAAASMLAMAARQAAERELFVVEAALRHDLVRLGDPSPEVTGLGELAAVIDGDLTPTMAAHASALIRAVPDELDAVAHRFAALGVDLVAAEAALDAAAGFRRTGLARRAAESEARARQLLAACGVARTPAMRVRLDVTELTAREREVATLAAGGLSNRAIAEALYLSPRTVENHLQRIYDKLGVAGRAELAGALGAGGPTG